MRLSFCLSASPCFLLHACLRSKPRKLTASKFLFFGRWSQLFDKETDWNIVADKGAGINDRQVKLSRGKYLGGCSGCNGTLCIRGTKQDYDDWGLEGWSGEEFFGYMRKVGRLGCF